MATAIVYLSSEWHKLGIVLVVELVERAHVLAVAD